MKLTVLFGLMIGASCSQDSAHDATRKGHKVTHIVWFDIAIASDSVGRIEIGLFGRLVPLTVYNFVDLSIQRVGQGYRRTKLFVVQKGFRIAGGDYSNNDGTGGASSDKGTIFEDEALKIEQYGAGWMVMPHSTEDYNTSLFFISLGPKRVVDKNHIVFGKVIKGMDVVRKIENVEVDANFRPIADVIITKCGAIMVDPPFYVARAPATD